MRRCPEEGSSVLATAAGICQAHTQGHLPGENRSRKVLSMYLQTPPNPACVHPASPRFSFTVTFTLGAQRWGFGCPGDRAGRRSLLAVKDSDLMSRDRVGKPPLRASRSRCALSSYFGVISLCR